MSWVVFLFLFLTPGIFFRVAYRAFSMNELLFPPRREKGKISIATRFAPPEMEKSFSPYSSEGIKVIFAAGTIFFIVGFASTLIWLPIDLPALLGSFNSPVANWTEHVFLETQWSVFCFFFFACLLGLIGGWFVAMVLYRYGIDWRFNLGRFGNPLFRMFYLSNKEIEKAWDEVFSNLSEQEKAIIDPGKMSAFPLVALLTTLGDSKFLYQGKLEKVDYDHSGEPILHLLHTQKGLLPDLGNPREQEIDWVSVQGEDFLFPLKEARNINIVVGFFVPKVEGRSSKL